MDHWLSEIAKFAPHLRVCYYDSANALLSRCSLIFKLFPLNDFLGNTADVVVSESRMLESFFSGTGHLTVLAGLHIQPAATTTRHLSSKLRKQGAVISEGVVSRRLG